MRFTAFHRPCALSFQPKVRHGQFPTSNANLLASHDETLLRDCPRRNCLKTTHNSNSAFSSRASFQDQTRQLGPPQSRVSTAECHFCVLNCMKQDTLCQQRLQVRIQRFAVANFHFRRRNSKPSLPKNTQNAAPILEVVFQPPKWAPSLCFIHFCNKQQRRLPFWKSISNFQNGSHF